MAKSVLKLNHVQGSRRVVRLEVFCQLGFNAVASLRRSLVTNLASGFPEQKLAKGVAGLFFAPIQGVPRSKVEKQIGHLLRQEFPDARIELNYRPAWLTWDGPRPLELDYFLPDFDLAIEVQGEQHLRFIPHFHRTPDAFAEQVRRDQAKREVCEVRSITLIEVSSSGDFEAQLPHIAEVKKRIRQRELETYILSKIAHELQANADILRKLRQTEIDVQTNAQLTNRLYKLRHTYSGSCEQIRYMSIRAIQAFYGLVPWNKRGWERYEEMIARKGGPIKNFSKLPASKKRRRWKTQKTQKRWV